MCIPVPKRVIPVASLVSQQITMKRHSNGLKEKRLRWTARSRKGRTFTKKTAVNVLNHKSTITFLE